MRMFYIIPIVVGFGIDVIDFGKWIVAYIQRKEIPNPSFGTLSVFFLPAWGLSGLIYFGKPPEEIMKVWNFFLMVLLIAFLVHLFIRITLPLLIVMVCNLYYSRKLLDRSPLPPLCRNSSGLKND